MQMERHDHTIMFMLQAFGTENQREWDKCMICPAEGWGSDDLSCESSALSTLMSLISCGHGVRRHENAPDATKIALP
jgi:hypothetical protein